MIGELGNLLLCFALAISIVQCTLPLITLQRNSALALHWSKKTTYLASFFVLASYLSLTIAFILHDYSLAYVADHANNNQPLIYRISAVWGAHEGSLLLWILMLSGWSSLLAKLSKNTTDSLLTRALSVLGFLNIGFISFTLFTSNPFRRLFPTPIDGQELNPLLQDPGLIIHPPMLYMGYVGTSVVFAFAIAAMIEGKLDSRWARWARPWTNLAWLFLTLGITIGSVWAYYELGWGGWWFWDPVENASFMPWLVTTALLHSLAVTEKRSALKAWSVLLAILAFSMSLLGTFLVRSGIITSVHAFASDPSRGLFILVFLTIIVGGSLLLYALRANQLKSQVSFALFSKESALLINNILLLIFSLTVLFGTLQPLIIDALTGNKISVGAPYFDFMFVTMLSPLALIMGIGALSRWKNDTFSRFWRNIILLAITSIGLSGLITYNLSSNGFAWRGFWGLTTAVWVLLWVLLAGSARFQNSKNWKKTLKQIPFSFWGMSLAHIGVAVFIVGITHVNTYSTEIDIKMQAGQTHTLGKYSFTFQGVKSIEKDNYRAQQGHFTVNNDILLYPEKRYYSKPEPMTEAAIHSRVHRDIYASLGENLGNGTWSVRLYVKSFVACIWFGGLLMALGALLSIFDTRFRHAK